MSILIILCIMLPATMTVHANQDKAQCDSQLLISSWRSNNIAIYDGCDYHFIRYLDNQNMLKGPQAIFQDHLGDVIVISEGNHQLLKYDGETLKFKDIVIPSGQIKSPISAVHVDAHDVLIFSYAENSIHRYDMTSWKRTQTLLTANNEHIRGIDLGPNFGSDSALYVPGYDSNNIIRIDLKSQKVTDWVNQKLGINRPRTILWRKDKAYVSAWGNSNIFELTQEGRINRIMFPMITGPSAMLMDGPDHMLMTSDRKNSVYRYGFEDQSIEVIVKEDTNHLDAATYVYRLKR